MKYGEWADYYHAYREIYNFEAKQNIYKDIEEEQEAYRRAHPELEPIGE